MRMGITGHRPNKLNNEYEGAGPVSLFVLCELQWRFELYKPQFFYSGMALGIDILTAELALANGIKLVACVPGRWQTHGWQQVDIDRYTKILQNKLTKTVIVSEGHYAPHKLHWRNKYVVDRIDHLVTAHDGSEGGTQNCINYALEQQAMGVPLVIDPIDLNAFKVIAL